MFHTCTVSLNNSQQAIPTLAFEDPHETPDVQSSAKAFLPSHILRRQPPPRECDHSPSSPRADLGPFPRAAPQELRFWALDSGIPAAQTRRLGRQRRLPVCAAFVFSARSPSSSGRGMLPPARPPAFCLLILLPSAVRLFKR